LFAGLVLASVPEDSVLESVVDRALTKKLQQFRALNTSKHGSTTFAEFYESSKVSLDIQISGWLPVDDRVQLRFASDSYDSLSHDAKEASVQEECNRLFGGIKTIGQKPVTSVYHDTHTMRYLDGRQPDCTFTVLDWLPSPLSVVLLGELTVHDFSPGMPACCTNWPSETHHHEFFLS
jgi:hypothetical protein